MGRTKGSGEGSIFKTENGWRGQIVLGYKRRSVSGKTKKEVADKLAQLRVEYNRGVCQERSDVTVREWTEQWITERAEPNMKPQSVVNVRGMFENHVYPWIGDLKLQDLDRKIIEDMYADAFKAKERDYENDQDYAQGTINTFKTQFKHCLQYAVECGVLVRNPHEFAKPAKHRDPKKVYSYTSADQERIISACKKGAKNHRIFYLLISTGMRFGEATALTWDDVNLETGEININKTVVKVRGTKYVQNMTKTSSGVRTIYVGDAVRQWLVEEYNEQDHERNTRNLVVHNRDYGIVDHAGYTRAWQRLVAIAGVEYQAPHSLRHTWGTRALEQGVDIKTVSQMLGHKNITTTMDVYQDVLDSQKLKCASALNALY